ncbi:MAG: metalloregulator ArsR/SmtB family transcription factor [Alcanivoracaceae bacterium]|nr:metalloregulator ArsR/SmtB family transcription factor [Alcanivoracaceae bacterium]
MQDVEQLSRAFKALSSPNRLRLFSEILRRQREAGGSEVCAPGCLLTDYIQRLGIGAPTVSHHLRELSDSGLIRLERQGRNVFCAVRDDVPQDLLNMIS